MALCRVNLADSLVYLVVLGWDWRWFGEVLKVWNSKHPAETIPFPKVRRLLCRDDMEDPDEGTSNPAEAPMTHPVPTEASNEIGDEWLM